MTYHTDGAEAQRTGEVIQRMLNLRARRNGCGLDKDTIVFWIEYLLANYPQVTGKYEHIMWQPGIMNRVCGNNGVAFEDGDVTLVCDPAWDGRCMAFSFRQMCDTAV